MTATEFAVQQSTLSKGVLAYLTKKGVLQDPLTPDDLVFLAGLQRVWADRTLLRSQLRKLSARERGSLVNTAEFPSRWQRYVYQRFTNHFLCPEQRRAPLPLSRIKGELKERFGRASTPQTIATVRKLRAKAREHAKYLRRAYRDQVDPES